jgi:peroxiredoxin
MLFPGTEAPSFSLYATPDRRISLSEFRGKKVIIAFYPADWSPVCSDQLTLYNEMLSFFDSRNAALIGISVDSKWCHTAFKDSRKFRFPMLADFEPKGDVAKRYQVYDDRVGECLRALYIVDEKGIIHWNYLSLLTVNPGADGIIETLEEMDKSKFILSAPPY